MTPYTPPAPIKFRYGAGLYALGHSEATLRTEVERIRRETVEECAKSCDELDNTQNTHEYASAARWCAERIRGLK